MDAMLRLNNIEVIYSDVILVLKGLSLEVSQGRIVALLGANGAGKTTTLKAISGLLKTEGGRVTGGSIEFLGRRIDGLEPERICRLGILQVMEGRKVLESLTVEENLRLGAYLLTDEGAVRGRLARVYDLFPRLFERRTQLAGTMSGGEQAMVSIGRGLMGEPRMLLIDEPSLGLSPLYVKENFNVIRRINEQGITVFLVEQNARQTLAISHYGYVLSQGRVVAAGTPDELMGSEEVHQAYFG